MLRRSLAIITVVSVAILVVLSIMTAPSTAGPLGILGFFVFMYIAALGVLTFSFQGLGVIIAKTPLPKRIRMRAGGLSFKKSYYYASVIALVPIMLIAMQSVGQIGVYQVLLVCFFVIIAWIYVTNRTT